jgi:hypothetical protein
MDQTKTPYMGYTGLISHEGNRIVGKWTLPGIQCCFRRKAEMCKECTKNGSFLGYYKFSTLLNLRMGKQQPFSRPGQVRSQETAPIPQKAQV